MFNDVSPWSEEIKTLLDIYDIGDLLDLMDITHERVLEILLEGGYVELPPFLINNNNNEELDFNE